MQKNRPYCLCQYVLTRYDRQNDLYFEDDIFNFILNFRLKRRI